MIVMGLEMVVHFDGPAIDGPFQLYNALRRIGAGQRPGVDFQFFHGLGIPYLHYVQFRLLGGTFFASEITRELTSAVFYPVVIVGFLRFYLKDWTRVAVWSVIVMALSIALRLSSVLLAINSLLGIRSTIPILLPIVLALGVRRPLRMLLAGIVIGLSLFFGSEQGLAVIAALLVGTAIALVRRGDRLGMLGEGAGAIAIGVVTLVVILLAIGGVDGMRGALAYNFRLVPMDQYWYFGAPPNNFIASWDSLRGLMALIPRIPITMAVGVAAAVFVARHFLRATDETDAREAFGLMVFAIYGLVSCASLLGTFVHVYVQPLIRVLLLIGAVYAARAMAARESHTGRGTLLGVGRSEVLAAAGSLVVLFLLVPSMIGTIGVTIPHFARTHVFGGQRAGLTGIWPQTINAGQAIIDARRNPDGSPPTLWSTYAGLLEARNGMYHPTVDYIIHALGPEQRAQYVSDFIRVQPRLVQTVLPTYTRYEAWIQSTSWDFYSDLLKNYNVFARTPWSLFWERQTIPNAAPQEVLSKDVAPGASGIDIPAAPPGNGAVLLEVELTYRVRNTLHALPVIGALPRYLVSIENAAHRQPTSLNPYVTTTRFPVIAYRGKTARLKWGAFSPLPGAGLEVSRVKVSFVPISGANLTWLQSVVTAQSNDTE
jgi:hypothetical protein